MRNARLLIPSLLVTLAVGSGAVAQTVVRVSVDSLGGEANGYSFAKSLSADGRYALFQSAADNLVAGDVNGVRDLFIHDALTGTTTCISVDLTGVPGNGESSFGRLTPDGRYVVFTSEATNLVARDVNGEPDVFVRDLTHGVTELVSVNNAGYEGNSSSGGGTISANGRYVAFASNATNLVAVDLNGRSDVFLHDRNANTTVLISVTQGGVQADDHCLSASISEDGALVEFEAWGDNLIPGDTNDDTDVLVSEVATGALRRVSVATSGAEGNHDSSYGRISGDGRFVVFQTTASNLVAGDTNASADILVHELATAITTRVSVSSSGLQANGKSIFASITRDGRLVAFESYANNLIAGDTTIEPDVFLHDRATGQTSLISRSSGGELANGWSRDAELAPGGGWALFTSDGTNLAPPDTNALADVFVRRLALPGTSLARAGVCPGAIDLTISNATPGGAVALLYGAAGVFVKSSGACNGIELGIAQPQLGAMLNANASGTAAVNFWTATACGRTVQAVDLATCSVTNAIVL